MSAEKKLTVEFHGIETHASGAPERGRSALDAMLLTFQGLAFLREHVETGSSIDYQPVGSTGPVNIIHGHAKGELTLRANDEAALASLEKRARKVIEGALLMSETGCDVREG